MPLRPQLSVSTSSITTKIYSGLRPSSLTSTSVMPLMTARFCSTVAMPLAISTLTYGTLGSANTKAGIAAGLWLLPDDLDVGEEILDLLRCGLRRVRPMHRVLAHVQRELLADGAGCRLLRVRRAHHLAVFEDGVLALEHLHHDRGGAHLLDQLAEERPLLVDGVEALGLRPGDPDALAGDDAEAGVLDLGDDLAGEVATGRVGLDDREGAFERHWKFLGLPREKVAPCIVGTRLAQDGAVGSRSRSAKGAPTDSRLDFSALPLICTRIMLTITDLTYRIEGRPLFEGASVVLPDGAKAGFVGKNGAGKTTLFRLILGQISLDAGSIEVNRRARIGAVAQEAPATELSVLETVMAADTERGALLAEAETATDPHRIADIHVRLADIDAHTAEARASTILRGLGFTQERQLAPTSELSGGWRMRVALAGVLFSQPDLLLLDEPTNYLDLEGTLWLEKYLATYPYTVFMISHDRDLLNKAVNSIVHLEHRKLTFYKGNYDTFENTRRMQMELNNKGREKALDQVAHMQKFVDRFKAKASKAKQAQARVKMIEKLKPPAAMFDEYSSPFTFQQPKLEMASPMITLDGVAAGYGDHKVLKNITMRIDPDDRIALIGVNGNGKSTFAKLLAGDIQPMGGEMRRGKKLEIAHFAQHQMDKLRADWTPLQHIVELMPYDNESK